MTRSEIWRKRAWLKFKLMGFFITTDMSVRDGIVTQDEMNMLEQLERTRKNLLKNFDEKSKLLGFNVSKRCWCGRVAKYKPNYEFPHGELVCKRHIEK